MSRRFLSLAVAALALGGAVLVYRGPGRAIVRGHLGDVAATMLVAAVLGLAWRARWPARAAAAFGIALAIEVGQVWWRPTSPAGALLAGTTWDPLDLVAYALGVAIAVGWERPPARGRCARSSRSRASGAPRPGCSGDGGP